MSQKQTAYPFRENLFVTNPYDEIELDGVEGDVQGWGSQHGIFEPMLQHFRPLTIIELGSWKGASAINMASICKRHNISAQILCVDNWIGFPSFYFHKEKAHHEYKIKGGFPRLYWTFMKNVLDAGHQDMITPLVQQTADAAKICRAKNIRPDLVYIDADHSYDGCKSDLDLFHPLLADGGIILCDDYKWDGVKQAVDEHIKDKDATYLVCDNKILLSYDCDLSPVQNLLEQETKNKLAKRVEQAQDRQRENLKRRKDRT